jgi:two-component system, NtrC family, sensor histidine kinase HydH
MPTPTVRGRAGEDVLREILRRLSHEIRNPLASLKAGVQLLQRLTLPEGEIADYFNGLLTQVGRIDRIVEGFHLIARLETGFPGRQNLARAVEAACLALRPVSARAGVGLRSEGPSAAEVMIDAQNLHLALSELLANAVKAAPAGSMVTVAWDSREDGILRIHVEDEGAGVSSEAAERMMQPFFSTQGDGRGLGLTTVARICQLAGGSLAWENGACGGCRFTMELPCPSPSD